MFLKSATPASPPPATSEEGIAGTRERGRERAQEEVGNNRAGCLAAQDDEETEQGPFDDTIGET